MITPFNQKLKKPQPVKEGCRIRIRRTPDGKIKEIETNGKCSRAEIELFKENSSEVDDLPDLN